MKNFSINFRPTLAIVLTLAMLLLCNQPLKAADITVCTEGSCNYTSIQEAVDAANDSDVIKVAAGTYTGVSTREGVTQVVYIDKSVTIRGGYTTDFIEPHDYEG